MTALSRLIACTRYSALAYVFLQVANLVANLLMLKDAPEFHAGTTSGQFITSSVINLVVTLGLYFWVFSLLKNQRVLGRILGSISAVISGLGALIYALLIFGNAAWVSMFCLIFVVLNVLWMFAAWKKEVTEKLS